jgi:hypothetical protein
MEAYRGEESPSFLVELSPVLGLVESVFITGVETRERTGGTTI